MNQQADIKPLPSKPPQLLPSDQSIQQQDDVQQPQGIHQATQQNVPVVSPPTNVQAPAAATANLPAQPPPPAGNTVSQQMQPQIVIRYGDGCEEVIDVDNIDSVRRVAKAGQVIKPLQGTLSGSYPQANKPQQLSTSSVPVALQPGVAFEDEADEAAKASTDVIVDVPQAAVVDVSADAGGDGSQPHTGLGSSQDDKGDAVGDSSSGPKETKKKDAQSRQKYQSYSAPAVSEIPHDIVDLGSMLSTPALR